MTCNIEMRILLIYPPFQIGEGMGKTMCGPPLSLLTLAGATRDLNHYIEILDLNVDPSYRIDKLEQKIQQYDMIGITCMTSTFGLALKICKIAKNYNISTILGGFHPTLVPNIIEEFDCIDMICRGEGDITFRELLEGKPKDQILGLSYRKNGVVIHNPDRPLFKNLDKLPFPENDLVHSKPYHYLWVPAWVCETSRGCPFKCNFCCVTQFYRATYRTKSPERVIKELMRVPNTTKLILFADDNFTLQKKRATEICKLLEKTKLSKRFMFICQSRVDDIANNPDMVKTMSKAGFICIFLGFESFKQMSLNYMEKQYTLDKVRKSINICHKNGIMVFGSFIIGNIGEDVKDTRRTFKLMKELGIDLIITCPITPFPGTPLHDDAVEKGWISEDFKWEKWDFTPVMNTPDLTKHEIRELVAESYRFFYKNIIIFGKRLARILFNSKFWWFRNIALSLIKNGLTKFLVTI
ncbi:MAG: B12-binding domain-containing radical SAM protein [Candidatus Hermodarchaeota archaeon]